MKPRRRVNAPSVGGGLLLSAFPSTRARSAADTLQATSNRATAAAQTFKNEKDRTGLLGKLDSASTKLTQGKTQDPLVNLTSLRDKVTTLAAQGKLGRAEADDLIAGANEAMACVTDLQTQAAAAA
jgi:hypothetical protein